MTLCSLHASGIDVLIDVVYNHTAEADDHNPYTLSFRGIESKTYYMTDLQQKTQLLNFSGCGNTVNANHPVRLAAAFEHQCFLGALVLLG